MKQLKDYENRSYLSAIEAAKFLGVTVERLPYELPYRLIKAFSYIGETVLDPFVGSATTLIAAADLKRNGIGYEINSDIAQDALKNLKHYQTKLCWDYE